MDKIIQQETDKLKRLRESTSLQDRQELLVQALNTLQNKDHFKQPILVLYQVLEIKDMAGRFPKCKSKGFRQLVAEVSMKQLELKQKLRNLEKVDKNKPVLLYCDGNLLRGNLNLRQLCSEYQQECDDKQLYITFVQINS